MEKEFVLRIRIIYILIFIFGFIILTRLFFIQVVRSDDFKTLANNQYFAVPAGYFDRGNIYFKKKDGQLISAGVTKKGFLLAINPKFIDNPQEVYDKLSKIIEIDKNLFFKAAEKKDDIYEEISHKISAEQIKKINELGIKGVNNYSESWRFYPAKNLASSVIGFVGYNGNKMEGRYGLERYYESFLNRRADEKPRINSFAEIIMDIKNFAAKKNQEGDIVLTIEPEVQNYLENTLEDVFEKYDAEMAGGLIIEPGTGKILALSVKPDFDPNNYGKEKNLSVFLNPLIENVFEMGSIMKPITLSIAFDLNKITPDTTYNDYGYIILDNARIENYDVKARGEVNMQEVLNKSLNTGAVFAMQEIGKEKFREYLIKFGFGEKTGVDLPNEITGLISNLNSNKDVEYGSASFGQGIALTPIEMVSALSALANGGVLMKPYIVEKIKLKNFSDIKMTPQERRRVLKKETSEEISRMLVKVADDALLNGTVKIDHYTFAAKTGTAQLLRKDGKGYSENEYLHTFFGYTPGFNAKFLTFLILKNPKEVQYSAQSLGKPFVDITKFLLDYYEIPPDR